MKFGIRTPSFKSRIAARTSWKRIARHSLGLKAPSGWGWLTNPKKAAYNRVYNRTSVSLDRFLTGGSRVRRRRASSANRSFGCLFVIGILLIVPILNFLLHNVTVLHIIIIIAVLSAMAAFVFWLKRTEEANIRVAKEAAYQARINDLLERFGQENTDRILSGELWMGATSEMVIAMLGYPSQMQERVLKTKTTTVYKYFQNDINRLILRITLDDGVVVKWDDMRNKFVQ